MAHSAHDYQPGQSIPGTVYQVVRLIGAGGMGTVYDVEDTTIGKRYVLKTLHSRLGTREDLAQRMRSEARTLARLHHPNIVDVITAGVTTDALHLPFYVMERLSGQSLRVVLDKKFRLDITHAIHIEIDLLDALDHAHDKGVIHRDVKPDNIFLHRTIAGVTVTKLLDFGIMSLLDAGPNEPTGRFMGTLRYAAPEQLRGEKPSPRVDVYSAALVIYEMLTGRGPFDDEGESERVAAAHLQKEPPPMSRFADVPKELDQLVAVALSKSPWCRPRDAFSFATSLRNIKRVLLGDRAVDSTASRATAVGPVDDANPISTLVVVQQASPDGPYVISPVGPAGEGRGEIRALTSGTNPSESATVPGVSAPATDSDSPQAAGTTATLTPISSPGPQHGTADLRPTGSREEGPSTSREDQAPPLVPMPSSCLEQASDAVSPAGAGSIGPQMRSFRAGAHPPIAGRVRTFAIVGVLAAAATTLLIARSARRGEILPASAPLPVHYSAADVFEVAPPPTIAPPAFDDLVPTHPRPGIAVIASSMVIAPSPSLAATAEDPRESKAPAARPAPSGKADKKDKARVQPARVPLEDRPGPGF